MKIETEKGHEIVSRVLLTKIRDGEWKPGDKLPSVVELSASFGVGRSTVREALSALKATGWLDIRHGGGTFVKKELPSERNEQADPFKEAASIMELLEVRKVLETGTATLAARNRTAADLEALGAVLVSMRQALENDDTAAGEQADVAFHAAIAAASHNSLLSGLMDSMAERLGRTIGQTRELWFYQETSTAARLLEEHHAIYDAIAAGNAEEASRLIGTHLTKVEMVLRERM
ncbi:MAG: GntR family transcriptional regulator [Paenibacillus sp.]|jgi:GntR family transcriptional repressor for pyruvate dehydrogenase complex|nr:GntR family transcriptional regulator [Paenibacillus sp.]